MDSTLHNRALCWGRGTLGGFQNGEGILGTQRNPSTNWLQMPAIWGDSQEGQGAALIAVWAVRDTREVCVCVWGVLLPS